MSKVSIIVPVYNAEKTIDRCVTSILKQSYVNLEILLINDGSKDTSLEHMNLLSKIDKRIIIIDKPNEGVARTRNLGILKATGKYIMFVDNDDYMDEDYVETFVKAIKEKKSDIVIGGYRRENFRGKILLEKSLKDTFWSRYILMAPWAKIYKRQYLLKNQIKFLSYPIGEDVYFSLHFIALKAKISVIDYMGYVWYYNEKSVSNTIQKGIKKEINLIGLLNKLNDLFKEKDEYTKYFFYKYCVWYLLYSGRNAYHKDFVKEYKILKESLQKHNNFPIMSSFSKKLNGESLKDRLSVFVFRILEKCHLLSVFSLIYCRGGKE